MSHVTCHICQIIELFQETMKWSFLRMERKKKTLKKHPHLVGPWFQPLWKICDRQNGKESSPKVRGEHTKNIWNHPAIWPLITNLRITTNFMKQQYTWWVRKLAPLLDVKHCTQSTSLVGIFGISWGLIHESYRIQDTWMSNKNACQKQPKKSPSSWNMKVVLLMEEILHQLIGSLSHYLQGFCTSQVVQDFSHQQ